MFSCLSGNTACGEIECCPIVIHDETSGFMFTEYYTAGLRTSIVRDDRKPEKTLIFVGEISNFFFFHHLKKYRLYAKINFTQFLLDDPFGCKLFKDNLETVPHFFWKKN